MVASPSGDDDRPPFFKTWRGAYLLVLGVLAATIVVFALISSAYR